MPSVPSLPAALAWEAAECCVGAGRRSLAYRLRLQAADRNLTEADIAEVRTKVTTAAGKLGAELRG